MDPLRQYGAYEFIPYLTSTSPPPNQPSFVIKHASTWTYCGPLLTPTDLPSSLHTWSSIAVSSPSALLQRLVPLLAFLRSFLSAAGVQHYWLTLRATTPTDEYDMPRWHVDDDFFSAVSSVSAGTSTDPSTREAGRKRHNKGSWKLCTALLGPSTLFLPHHRNARALHTLRSTKQKEAAERSHSCTSIRCAGCFDTGAAVRSALATAFSSEERVQAREGEMAFFRTGDEAGAVHSEPPCGLDRVFVNVVPGTERELRALMARFGMPFPRAWSLGLPAHLEDDDGLERMGESRSGQGIL